MTSKKINYIKKLFGQVRIIKGGQEVSIRCPNCGSTSSEKFKLDIRLSDDMFSCWVCGIKGRSLYPLIKKFKPEHLAEYSNFKQIRPSDIVVEEEKIELPPAFQLFHENLIDPDVRQTVKYAFSRGINESTLFRFRMGTCKTGRFRRRLIMPSFDGDGNLNYFVGRAIDSSQRVKYLNAPVKKKDVIFNEIDIDWQKEIVLVEGPLDLVKCTVNATCLLGSHLDETYKLFQKIINHNTPVILALDADVIQKTQKIAALLHTWGILVKIVNLPLDKDVGDLNEEEFVNYVSNAIQWKPEHRLKSLISSISSGSIL